MTDAERDAKYGPLLTVQTVYGPRTYRDYLENFDHTCVICGKVCDDGYRVDDKPVCLLCFILWPWNVNPDYVDAGIEQGGTGI